MATIVRPADTERRSHLKDETLSHYRLENGKILITQGIAITGTQPTGKRKRQWVYATVCFTDKQLARLAKKYLTKGA